MAKQKQNNNANEPDSARQISKPATGTETVTVACKLPNGLILRLFDEVEVSEPVMGGGSKTVKQFIFNGQSHNINGWGTPHGQAPKNYVLADVNCALTMGVPKDFWEKWLHQNSQLEMVQKNLVFAYEGDKDYLVGKAEELKGVRSGLEGLTPDNDPRIPKRRNRDTGQMESTMQSSVAS